MTFTIHVIYGCALNQVNQQGPTLSLTAMWAVKPPTHLIVGAALYPLLSPPTHECACMGDRPYSQGYGRSLEIFLLIWFHPLSLCAPCSDTL